MLPHHVDMALVSVHSLLFGKYRLLNMPWIDRPRPSLAFLDESLGARAKYEVDDDDEIEVLKWSCCSCLLSLTIFDESLTTLAELALTKLFSPSLSPPPRTPAPTCQDQ